MTQINQYANEATDIFNDDFLDIDKDMGGGNYESRKIKWGTLATVIGGIAPNLGNTNLTQSSADRYFDGVNQRLEWQNMRKFWIDMTEWGDDPANGFRVKRNFGVAPTNKNRVMAEFLSDMQSYLKIYEEGMVNIREGGIGVSDGTIPLSFGPGNSSNSGLLALFMALTKPSVFTDIIFPEAPVEVNDSFLVWFRTISKGVRMPTMSEVQRDSILTPEIGLQIFNITANKMQCYTGIGVSGWSNMN